MAVISIISLPCFLFHCFIAKEHEQEKREKDLIQQRNDLMVSLRLPIPSFCSSQPWLSHRPTFKFLPAILHYLVSVAPGACRCSLCPLSPEKADDGPVTFAFPFLF